MHICCGRIIVSPARPPALRQRQVPVPRRRHPAPAPSSLPAARRRHCCLSCLQFMRRQELSLCRQKKSLNKIMRPHSTCSGFPPAAIAAAPYNWVDFCLAVCRQTSIQGCCSPAASSMPRSMAEMAADQSVLYADREPSGRRTSVLAAPICCATGSTSAAATSAAAYGAMQTCVCRCARPCRRIQSQGTSVSRSAGATSAAACTAAML